MFNLKPATLIALLLFTAAGGAARSAGVRGKNGARNRPAWIGRGGKVIFTRLGVSSPG